MSDYFDGLLKKRCSTANDVKTCFHLKREFSAAGSSSRRHHRGFSLSDKGVRADVLEFRKKPPEIAARLFGKTR